MTLDELINHWHDLADARDVGTVPPAFENDPLRQTIVYLQDYKKIRDSVSK